MNTDVREITESELNNMVSGQKLFFEGLIAQGRAKIVSSTTAPAPKKEDTDKRKPGYTPREPPASPFTAMLDHEVKLLLVDGAVLTGRLTVNWQYEVTLKTAFSEVIVLKHSISTLELVS
jgi:hypothetical protein